MVLTYLIKDLTNNKTRFDSWVELALTTSSKLLDEYPDSVRC
jgi:hypothetical protein